MKDESTTSGEKNKEWRAAGAPPKSVKKRKKKGIRPKYANGKDGLREKV
jgi:hypothetical protein